MEPWKQKNLFGILPFSSSFLFLFIFLFFLTFSFFIYPLKVEANPPIDCFVAGWAGTFAKGQNQGPCQKIDKLMVKTKKEGDPFDLLKDLLSNDPCKDQNKEWCNPAFFGPDVCVDKVPDKNQQHLNLFCIAQATSQKTSEEDQAKVLEKIARSLKENPSLLMVFNIFVSSFEELCDENSVEEKLKISPFNLTSCRAFSHWMNHIAMKLAKIFEPQRTEDPEAKKSLSNLVTFASHILNAFSHSNQSNQPNPARLLNPSPSSRSPGQNDSPDVVGEHGKGRMAGIDPKKIQTEEEEEGEFEEELEKAQRGSQKSPKNQQKSSLPPDPNLLPSLKILTPENGLPSLSLISPTLGEFSISIFPGEQTQEFLVSLHEREQTLEEGKNVDSTILKEALLEASGCLDKDKVNNRNCQLFNSKGEPLSPEKAKEFLKSSWQVPHPSLIKGFLLKNHLLEQVEELKDLNLASPATVKKEEVGRELEQLLETCLGKGCPLNDSTEEVSLLMESWFKISSYSLKDPSNQEEEMKNLLSDVTCNFQNVFGKCPDSQGALDKILAIRKTHKLKRCRVEKEIEAQRKREAEEREEVRTKERETNFIILFEETFPDKDSFVEESFNHLLNELRNSFDQENQYLQRDIQLRKEEKKKILEKLLPGLDVSKLTVKEMNVYMKVLEDKNSEDLALEEYRKGAKRRMEDRKEKFDSIKNAEKMVIENLQSMISNLAKTPSPDNQQKTKDYLEKIKQVEALKEERKEIFEKRKKARLENEKFIQDNQENYKREVEDLDIYQ